MQSENQPPEATNVENGPDQDVTLNYIDKAYDMYVRASSFVTRSAIILVIASSLMLTISVGWVSAQKDFSLGGLGLKVSLVALLGGAIVLIAAVYIAFYAAFVRMRKIENEIPKLYKTIGYEETSITDWQAGLPASDILRLLVAPGWSESARSTLTRYFELVVALVVLFVLFILLPLIAEIAMLVKLASIVGWHRFYIWLPLAVFVVIVASAPWLLFRREES